jgi:hypothetical protein
MKKTFIVSILFLIAFTTSNACEICGCGVGNFYMGMLPRFKSKFIGVRYSYMRYHTELAADKTQFSDDYYKTAEVWTGWNLSEKWQLLGFVPYHFNKKISDDGIKETNGLGDITLLTNYKLLHTRKTNAANGSVEQQLWIGGGIKLPTGAYHVDLSDPDANIGDVNSQAGTGTTDFLLNGMYHININRTGISTSLNYKINTANSEGYRFGNRLSVNSFVYHRLPVVGISIAPNIGVLYEHASINHSSGDVVEQTGGYIWNASAGVELNFNKIAVGINALLPVAQDFAERQTNAKNRGVVHVSFAL